MLARRAQADNFVVVQSGDEIRSLPNANAAESDLPGALEVSEHSTRSLRAEFCRGGEVWVLRIGAR